MPRRKDRISVVFDTNVFITRFLKKQKRTGINRRIFDLFQKARRLQLIVSPPIIDEYLYVLKNYLGFPADRMQMLEFRLQSASNITHINLGKRISLSRDPKDNMFLETAHAGKAKFLLTKDNDLLDIPKKNLRGYRFRIVTPFDFLDEIGEI